MKKRILSILLLAAMLLTLAACGPNDDGPVDNNDDGPVDADAPAGIQKKNYKEDFNILYPNWGQYQNYFFVEENDGEAMSVALYNRELKIEEHLGLDINFVMADSNGDNSINAIYPSVQQMAMTGDNLYQIVLTHCIQSTAVMITDGLLLDLNTVDSINFDNEWWNKKSNENLSINGMQFYAVSDFNIPDLYTIIFNKTMIEENNLEDPYQLVRDGDWTMDKMMEMMKVITKDDGNGFWNIFDTYGFGAPSDHNLTNFTYACGLQLVDKDEDGMFKFALDTPKAYDVVEKIATLLKSNDTKIYYWWNGYTSQDSRNDPSMAVDMATGRCLFSIASLSELPRLRDITVDFGIIPFPKYDENQEDYVTLDWSGLMCAPLTAENHEMIGEVMELYGYFSGAEVIPAYYDIVLDEKLSRDDDSKDMLNIIFDSIVFDAGMNYFGFDQSMTKFWNLGSAISATSWSGYASFLETYKDGAITALDTFNEQIINLEFE